MTTRLTDVAGVIRSKNAGPYELTLDIIFTDRATYDRVVAAQAITADLISRLYHVPVADVLELVAFDPAAAIKITIRRPRVAGDVGETDVYGAQQHAPFARARARHRPVGQASHGKSKTRTLGSLSLNPSNTRLGVSPSGYQSMDSPRVSIRSSRRRAVQSGSAMRPSAVCG